MHLQKGKHILGHRTVEGDLVVRKGDAATLKSSGTASSGRIKNLTQEFLAPVAGIEYRDRGSAWDRIGCGQCGAK